MDQQLHASPYYPPRARWYSPVWRIGYSLKRWLRLRTIFEHDQEWRRALLGLALPGWALLWSRRPNLGVILGTLYCLAVPAFIIWRGYSISNFALLLMITIHAGGVLRGESFRTVWMRCCMSFLVFFAIAALIYSPVLQQIDRHWFVALRKGNRVVAIRTGTQHAIRRGDWIAYRINGNRRGFAEGVVVMEGTGMGEVAGVPGDLIKFEPAKFSVNGVPQPRRAGMPNDAVLQIEKGCYFIWPNLDMSNRGVSTEQIERALLKLAIVREADIIGVPYQRWFWRKQVLT